MTVPGLGEREMRQEPCPRVLFVTRKFPPSVGGMETLAAGVWRTLSATAPESVLVAHTGQNRALPGWLPIALARTIRAALSRRVDVVLTGDAPMYAVVSPFMRVLRVPCVTMAMGLDLTYENRLYRAVVLRALRRAQGVVAISEATAQVAREVGVNPTHVHVLRLGIDAPLVTSADRRDGRTLLDARLSTTDENVLLLALGRLVRRKGTVWFLRNVLPQLPPRVVFVIAGAGRESANVREAIDELGLAERVRLLDRVDDRDRELLLRGADMLVQPNIEVPGDMEGFGLVTIEAAVRGLTVVASDLEGIADAVVAGVTGTLLPPGDARAWIDELTRLTADRKALAAQGRRFQDAARERYSEHAMGNELAGLLRQAVGVA